VSITNLPALDFRRTTQQAARYPFLWLARDLSLNAQSGQAGATTDVGSRGSTDSLGTSVTTSSYDAPAWHFYNSTDIGGYCSTNAFLYWSVPMIPQAMCGILDLVSDNPTGLSFDMGLFDLSNGLGTGARLFIAITSSGTKSYELVYTPDGITFRRSSLAGLLTILDGDRLKLRWSLSASGQAQLYGTVGSGSEVTASTPAVSALPTAWGGTTIRLNKTEAANYYLGGPYIGCCVMMGNQTSAILAAAIA